jgi:hypothetical protein
MMPKTAGRDWGPGVEEAIIYMEEVELYDSLIVPR